MTDLTLYHNPRCSKSRGALELLEARGLAPTVVRYLETPPSAEELRSLLGKLGIAPRELLRSGEDEYKALGLADSSLSDAQLIAAMVAHPKLIERPILVAGERAVIGRTETQRRIRAMAGKTDRPVLYLRGAPRSGKSFSAELMRDSVETGQHDVEDDEVVSFLKGLLFPGVAVKSHVDGKPVSFEVIPLQFSNALVVFND